MVTEKHFSALVIALIKDGWTITSSEDNIVVHDEDCDSEYKISFKSIGKLTDLFKVIIDINGSVSTLNFPYDADSSEMIEETYLYIFE